MLAKTRTINGMMKTFKYASGILLIGNSTICMLLPEWLSTKGFPIWQTRIGTIVISSAISYHILTKMERLWVMTHNELLKKDVYDTMIALKQNAIIDDIDKVADMFDYMRNITHQVEDSQTKNDNKEGA